MIKRPMAGAITLSAIILATFVVGLLAVGRAIPLGGLFADKIGVIFLIGPITSSLRINPQLEEFRRDVSIKAIVLRIDSPGGGVAASQEIFREIQRTKKVKPVICSMGGVAASGGYYVAASCTKIVASPGTVTGSIGVISSIPEASELFKKIGIRLQVIKSGAVKGAGQLDRPLSESERRMIQQVIDDAYAQFVADVARARKLPVAKVRRLADGGVFLGARAKKYGLVDFLGNQADAVGLAAKLSGVKGRPKLVFPEDSSRGFWSRLLRNQIAWVLQELLPSTHSGGLMYLYRPPAPGR